MSVVYRTINYIKATTTKKKQMDLEDENIDSFIDMETLLNDPELNNELDLLLQNESKPVTRQPKRVINNMTNNTKSDEKYKEGYSYIIPFIDIF